MKNKLQDPVITALSPRIPKYLLVSYYLGGVTNKTPQEWPVTFSEVVRWIRSNDTLKQRTEQYRATGDKDLKRKLPYITAAGVFSTREESGFLLGTHLHIIDIDNVPEGEAMHPETGEEIDKVDLLKYRIFHDKNLYCLATWRSPTGNGVKSAIWQPGPGNMPQIEAYQEIHKSLDCYIQLHHVDKIGGHVDRQCFDLARATFLCHDADILALHECLPNTEETTEV